MAAPKTKAEAAEAVPEDAKVEAQANLDALNKKRAEPAPDLNDFNAPRTLQGGRDRTMIVSEIPVPDEADFRLFGPTAFAADLTDLVVTGEVDTQEFRIDKSKATVLQFTQPNQNLPKKRLYVIKALHRDGRLVQLAAELQHNNNAGGDPEDFIGLNRYRRKGLILLVENTITFAPLYCAAWGCFAQANNESNHAGFCGIRHAKHTLPNRYKNADQIVQGLMEAGVTTSRTWSM